MSTFYEATWQVAQKNHARKVASQKMKGHDTMSKDMSDEARDDLNRSTIRPRRGGVSHLATLLPLIAIVLLIMPTTKLRADFPFTIDGGHFLKDGNPVFLNVIGYQPYEPGQSIGDPINVDRVMDDMQLLQAYRGGSDPVAIRLYPQPGSQVPLEFFDGIRNLGFWIVRDIYFSGLDIEEGKAKIDEVIREVHDAGAGDRVFSWQIGNEFRASDGDVAGFLCAMTAHIKQRVPAVLGESASDWVTFGSWPMNDPLRSDPWSAPVETACLDYISYNAYSYWPERVRDHQAGPGTGTPYAGYLAALKEAHGTGKPLVVSESGYADSPPGSAPPVQNCLRPSYPVYRYGDLTPQQASEGLAARYWDARLSGAASGFTVFEWVDEWHKTGNPDVQDDAPEEHFGLFEYLERTPGRYTLRPKPQAAIISELFSLKYDEDLVQQVSAQYDPTMSRWDVSATLSNDASGQVRLRWETDRGYVIGESEINADQSTLATAEFHFGDGVTYLGPATITAIAISNGWADYDSVSVDLPGLPELPDPSIELFTLGEGDVMTARASGQVENTNLDSTKLIAYILTDDLYIQPFVDQNSLFVGSDGYWWTNIANENNGDLYVWLVDEEFDPPTQVNADWQPDQFLAFAAMEETNDADNDLLPDDWEVGFFDDIGQTDRYDDPDGDLAYNLEELLWETSPTQADDTDGDGLWDPWERRLFGTLAFDADDDPEGDGQPNLQEMLQGTHPAKGWAAVPEPTTVALTLLGLLGLACYGARRRRKLSRVEIVEMQDTHNGQHAN